MVLMFDVSPSDGEMTVQAKYTREEITHQCFYLNRDAQIMTLLCDEVATDFESCEVVHPMFAMHGDYIVRKVTLPFWAESLEVGYRLKLSGKTGSWPYVRESITPEFTFIRQETFCYPMFFDDWDGFRSVRFAPSTIYLDLPVGFEVVASERIIEERTMPSGIKRIAYTSCKQGSSIFNCAIAPYIKVDFTFGTVYFLNDLDAEKKNMIEEVMNTAHDYMNEHFGHQEIQSNLIYAAIPDGFGSFACVDVGVVFVQESTFKSVENLNEIVHEFIHLGWNAVAKNSVQRARFFDEAFTSYFEMRVMRHLLQDNTISGCRSGQRGIDTIKSGKYQLVPICEYGTMGYGDLSYRIGAMCLDELCSLLGQDPFDAATTAFLQQYQETPADFENFCAAYKMACGVDHEEKLTKFFEDWIYSTKALEAIMAETKIG